MAETDCATSVSSWPALGFLESATCRLAFCLVLTLSAPLWNGCRSPERKVAQRLPELQKQWQTNVRHQLTPSEAVVDWPTAVSLMQSNNLKLRHAKNGISNSLESLHQVYRELLPTLNLRSGVSRSLKNIPATTFDDVTFSLDSFFNVPGILSFHSRLFAARLGYLRAKALYLLAEREQMIELYKVVVAAQEHQAHEADLKTEQRVAETVQNADPLTGQVLLKQSKGHELSLATEAQALQSRISDLFGDRQHHWVLRTNGWPSLVYEDQPLPLDDTNRVARLQIRLAAIEMVGAWAQLHGIKLLYWPDVTIFVSGPPIYQRDAGTEHFWSSGDVRASADLFWSIDTRGYISRQLRQVKREQEVQLTQLQQDSLALIDRLLKAQNLCSSLREQLQELDKLISVLEKVPLEQDFTGILQAAETNRSLREQRLRVRRELAELNALFWFVDEQKWAALKR